MPALAPALPIIRPINDLRTQLNAVCAQATETQEPIVLTKNGSASYILIDCNAYEAEKHENRVRMALREAEIEERHKPETISAEESNSRISAIFEAIGLEYAPKAAHHA